MPAPVAHVAGWKVRAGGSPLPPWLIPFPILGLNFPLGPTPSPSPSTLLDCLALPPPRVVLLQAVSAAPLAAIKFMQLVEAAALLTEAALDSIDHQAEHLKMLLAENKQEVKDRVTGSFRGPNHRS